MDVGVGILARVAKPFDVNTGIEEGCCHPALGVKVELLPPTVSIIKDHVHINASILSVDHRFDQMHFLKQIHVDVK